MAESFSSYTHSRMPYLFILRSHADEKGRIASIFRVSTLEDSRNLDFSEISEKNWICGCTRGSLLMVGASLPHEVRLINPFKKTLISLPPLTSFEYVHQLLQSQETFLVPEILKIFVKKVVSSTNPPNPDSVVLIIYSIDRKLAFCRPGDKIWTDFESNQWNSSIVDIVFINGDFLAINRDGEVLYCDLNPTNPKASPLSSSATPFRFEPGKKYFAETIWGKLWVVLKKLQYNDTLDFTVYFEIYELDSETKEWKRVRDLKGQSLFLSSQGQSMAALVDKEGTEELLNGDSVYFTDDFSVNDSSLSGLANLSVLDWESKQIKKIYQPSSWNSQLYWITPQDLHG